MSLDRWSRVKPLFEAALERPPEARTAFLAEACDGDDSLRAEVERLLALDAEADGFFDTLSRDLQRPAFEGAPPPERVGPWRVVREVGRGGMGRVLLAERDDGAFEQRVAVKLVESAAPGLVRRFRRERRILAALDHPNVARLLDGGALPDGRPYLIMEYVEGAPLTAYADAQRLGVDARLRLFLQVCEAVAYAHRALVVHRDLKPSNILVTDAGRVKLLDFGVARLLDDDGEDGLTRTAPRFLTPVYAAPEQVRGDAVTTDTDVYALGVLLYELLTGHRPFDPRGRSRHTLERAILEDEPAAPSTAVGWTEERAGGGALGAPAPEAVAAARATEPGRLRRRLRGDLDRIVLKALRKEPERRYGSVEALARDVERHLAGLPVEARPATLGYRAQRFLRRHRAGVAAAAAVGGILLALGALHTASVAAERDRAEAAALRAERVSAFLTDLLGRAADPAADTGALLRLLEPAVARADSALAADPEAQAAVFYTLGRLYHRAGRPDRAEVLLRRALALRRALDAGPSEEAADVLYALGLLRLRQPDVASARFREAAEMRRALLVGDDHDLAWSLLQWARMLPKGHPDKQPRFEEALAMLARLHGERSPEVAEGLHEYYVLGFADGTPQDYEAAFREALAIYLENGMERSPHALHAMYNLGLLYEGRGDVEAAFPLFERAIRLGRQVLPPGTSSLNTMTTNYGASLHEQGRLAEADSVLRGIAETTRRALPDSAQAVGHSHYWYGRNLLALGRPEEAEAALRTAAAVYAYLAEGGARHRRVQVELAWALVRRGRYAEAEALLLESVGPLRGSRFERLALERLAALYEATGRPAEAAPYRARLDELGE